MPNACCDAPDWYMTAWCFDCHDEVCSSCAAVFEREDGYDSDGQGIRTFALCRPCETIRDERRQRREARNDSGV